MDKAIVRQPEYTNGESKMNETKTLFHTPNG